MGMGPVGHQLYVTPARDGLLVAVLLTPLSHLLCHSRAKCGS